MPITFLDLRSAYEFVNFNEAHATVYIGKQTGTVYAKAGSADFEGVYEDLPEDVDDAETYAVLPNRHDLDLGKQLPLDFAPEFLPNDADNVIAMFERRGGYKKFRSLVTVRGVLDRWYKFESDATEQALRDWCQMNGITIAP